MAIVPSYFSTLAESQNLQAMIDNSLDNLQKQSMWRGYLTPGIQRMELTFQVAIGRARIEAAASVVDQDAPAPLRSRNTLELLTGNIPSIKQKFRLSQSEMRALEVMRALNVQNDKQALIAKLWDDVSKCAVAGDKRIDHMFLQGLSTFSIDVSTTNNPDGVAYGTISLLNKAYQKQGVPVAWAANPTTATPIDDIENYIRFIGNSFGRSFGRILMSESLWFAFKKTTQVQNYLKGFYNPGSNATYAVTLNNVNEFMISNRWPAIEVIDDVIGIESDGVITASRPFDPNNVVFVPNGTLGSLEWALPMERLHPVAGKSYANFGPTLVGKWAEQDPLVEYTGMEMNAFPAIDVDNIFILDTDLVQASFNTTA